MTSADKNKFKSPFFLATFMWLLLSITVGLLFRDWSLFLCIIVILTGITAIKFIKDHTSPKKFPYIIVVALTAIAIYFIHDWHSLNHYIRISLIPIITIAIFAFSTSTSRKN